MFDGASLRRLWRHLREAVRDNGWLVPLIGGVLGWVLAQIVGTESTGDSGWTVTVDRSRDTLFGILGLMFAAVSIALALASVAAQNVVGRFGSRTLRIYLRRSPERWVLGTFALSAAFVMSEQFQLRKLPSDGPAPTTSLVVSVILLVVTACLLVAYIAAIVRWFRVDKAAIALRRASLEAARARVRATRIGDRRVSVPPRPDAAIDVLATRSGHLADVDREALLEVCRRLDAVAVITEPLGAAVIEGQPIGWIAGRDTPIESVPERELADAIDVSTTREVASSIEYGLVGMVDIAIIALSPGVNNPNTAVEVIEEMGFLFARLPHGELGPYALGDADGCRAIVVARTFGTLLDLGTTQIVLYGFDDPLVQRALERLADSLELLDLADDDRAHVDRFAAKVRG